MNVQNTKMLCWRRYDSDDGMLARSGRAEERGGNYKTKILAAANKEDCQIFLFIQPHLFPRVRIGGGMMDKSG